MGAACQQLGVRCGPPLAGRTVALVWPPISEIVVVTVGAAIPRFPKAQSTERFSALRPDDLLIAESDAVPFADPPSKGRCVGVRRLRPEWPCCALRQYGADMAWVASYAKATGSVASRSRVHRSRERPGLLSAGFIAFYPTARFVPCSCQRRKPFHRQELR